MQESWKEKKKKKPKLKKGKDEDLDVLVEKMQIQTDKSRKARQSEFLGGRADSLTQNSSLETSDIG